MAGWVVAYLLLGFAVQEPQAAHETEAEAEVGQVEFTRRDVRSIGYEIQIFQVLDGDRVHYVDEIGEAGDRRLLLELAPGKYEFVVVVSPIDETSRSRSDVVARRRPNVSVDVVAGHRTPVQVGGFTDFQRTPQRGDPSGTGFTRGIDPEASQFRARIDVGKPVKIEEK